MVYHDVFKIDCGSVVYDLLLRKYYILVGYNEESRTFVGIEVKGKTYVFDKLYPYIEIFDDRYKLVKKISNKDKLKLLMLLKSELRGYVPVRKYFVNITLLGNTEYVTSYQKYLDGNYAYVNKKLYHVTVKNGFVVDLDYALSGYNEDYMIGEIKRC